MRTLLFIFLLSLTLYAKKNDSCYTLQLQSMHYSNGNLKALQNKNFPQECTIMHIANALTVRCGCYEEYKEAKQKLPKYKKQYKHAYIATSYKYRFNTAAPSKKSIKHTPSNNTSNDDEEIKLMLQAFLYSNDLEHAYQTAKIGYTRHPNSYYWNQKMAEICRWSGRTEEAMKYLRFMYNKKEDEKLAKDIIDYGLSAYQYEAIEDLVTQEALKNPNKINIQRMVYIYTQTGEPQKAAKILHRLYLRTHNDDFLTKELQIYMDMGELQAAKEIVSTIERKQLYSYKNIQLLSYYYYLSRKIQKAYAVFHKVDMTQKYDKKLYMIASDLGWYLQHYKKAANLSAKILQHKQGRLVDYERVIYANKEINPALSMQTALEAYEKYHHSYLFYTFANNALKQKRFALLFHATQNIEKEKSPLTQEANYWLIKAQLYAHFKEREKARYALQKALSLDKHNIQITFTAIDLFLQYGYAADAKATLQELVQNNSALPLSLDLAVASLYYTLHDIDAAAFYTDKLQASRSTLTQTLAYKLLRRDIYKAQDKQEAALRETRTIQSLLQKQADQNPDSLKSDKYLYDYLRVSMDTLQADMFETKLSEAKPYLSQAHYNDLQYAWAIKNNADEKAHSIYLHTKVHELWIQFSNALMQQEHSNIEDLLFAYLGTLPLDDAAYGAENNGQTALGQSLAYTSLATNTKNKNAYIAWLNFTKKRSDLFDSKLAYYNRDPLLRKYIKIKNTNYINDGLYLLSHIEYYKNASLDTNLLLYTPNNSSGVDFGLRQLFNKAKVELTGGYAKSMESYYRFSLYTEYILNNYFTLKAQAAKNITADESTQLLLGGKKDMLSLGLTYHILNSTALELRYDTNSYTSQDNVAIGNGNYFTANLGYQIRNGYPDMHVGIFSDAGVYSENSGSKGVIDKLQNGTFKVLPKDFYNLGLNFSYGMQNSEIYTRVWRPYFEGSAYYSSELNDFTYGFSAGYGGKVYSQDHLIIGTHYTDSVSGVGGSILELFLRYEFLYTHR